ncbi:DUF86 domain-containing protein [Cronbergia sp. UHCC 0137]|uniref:HepT-like ribonuclease domain-containing protein n=1 Tax=Cronbergia sp. UHCC 0137 TaxID=3110239 RepID=UPI002B1FFFFE|nr:DUF86 domain-containing protein [Cronbergia sp. UHCC 0137]MEA5616249.1 DUF86 domain-containing protein [Cronbergia sp. UHCC 0137]
MSSRSWQLRVQDILERIDAISELVIKVSFEDVQNNVPLAKAILFDLLVIGEASANIDELIRQKYPEIPWRDIISMRNLVIHEYFRVSLEILWDTVKNDLPTLKQQLQNLLEKESQSSQ